MLSPYLLIGEITRPHGLHGEVKLRHYTDDPNRFFALQNIFIHKGASFEPLVVVGCRVQKEDVFLVFEGVANRDAAEKYRGVKLYVDRAHSRKLAEGEVFIADILGATAYDTAGNVIGVLEDVLTPGAADVFVFDTPHGRLLMPVISDVLLTMDTENGRIVLDELKLHEVALYENSHSYPIPGDV